MSSHWWAKGATKSGRNSGSLRAGPPVRGLGVGRRAFSAGAGEFGLAELLEKEGEATGQLHWREVPPTGLGQIQEPRRSEDHRERFHQRLVPVPCPPVHSVEADQPIQEGSGQRPAPAGINRKLLQRVPEICFRTLQGDQSRGCYERGTGLLYDFGPVDPERIVRSDSVLLPAATEFEVRLPSTIEGSAFPEEEDAVTTDRMGDGNLNHLGFLDGAGHLMGAEENEALGASTEFDESALRVHIRISSYSNPHHIVSGGGIGLERVPRRDGVVADAEPGAVFVLRLRDIQAR